MSAQHTPGPWEAVIDSQTPSWVWVAPADWHTRVCRVVLYAYEKEEQQANARLIAAAPDLLAALEAGAECLVSWMEMADPDYVREPDEQVLAAMRAAIAKARGEA